MISAPFRTCLVLAAALTAGCSGNAQLQFVSTSLTAIDPPPPIVYRYDPQQCFSWVEDSGAFTIAMRFDNISPFSGLGKLTLQMSYVLESPPAGTARDYAVGPREVRGCFDAPIGRNRFLSQRGIISVIKTKNGFKGSFRVTLQHYPAASVLNLLPQRPGTYLLFGTFESVNDPVRCKQIRDVTEADGWTRPTRDPVPTSQPDIMQTH